MQKVAENFRAHLPLLVPAKSSQGGMFKKCSTYLAMIAVVLQGAPNKMLTFTQLMDKLDAFVSGDRKGFENNIRVCLSTNKCFVKIPMRPEMSICKRNYWKFDHNQITAKMVRRHFKGILDQFPELASKVGMETTTRPPEHCTTLHPPEPAACKAVQIQCEVKFSSPFSIESLLKRDGPCRLGSKASPLSSVPVRVEQQPRSTERGVGTKRTFSWDSPPVETRLLQGSGGCSLVYTTGGNTDHGLTAAAKPMKKMCMLTEPSFLIYSRPSVAPYISSPQSSYIQYPVPASAHDVYRFRL